jgi:uncharacterized membrane protein YdbT with pleckstrin-like domain
MDWEIEALAAEITPPQLKQESETKMERRFLTYAFVIAAIAIIFILICIWMAGFWGFLIACCFVPIACIFGCGILAIFELFIQRKET